MALSWWLARIKRFIDRDVVAVRVTFRCGWGAMRPQRIVAMTTV
jgi:hypothetical protein